MKLGDTLWPLTFNYAPEYAISKVEETYLGLDMNGNHQILTYAVDFNIGDDIWKLDINAYFLFNSCKYIVIAVTIGQTKYLEV